MTNLPPAPSRVHRVVAGACGAVAGLLGLGTLLAWSRGWQAVAAFSPGFIPMAPNTAASFCALGAALLALSIRPGRRMRALAGTAGGAVALVAAPRLLELLAGAELGVDRWIFRPSEEVLRRWTVPGGAPVGKMSLATAAALAAAGASLVSRLPRILREALPAAVAGTGFVFLLGYLYGAPLLYGGRTIPMALGTAFGVLAVGVGLAAASGGEAFPLKALSGPSARARFLRALLPTTVAAVCLVPWLVDAAGGPSSALVSAVLAAASALAVAVLCARLARRVETDLRLEVRQREAAEDDRARVENRHRALVENVRDAALFLLDPRGLVTLWNTGAERLYGYSAGEIEGRSLGTFYPPEEAAAGAPERSMREAREKDRCEEEGWRVRQDGTRFWARVVRCPLRGPSGEIEGYSTITQDLTERRAMEQALIANERRLKDAQKTARLGSWEWDIEKDRVWWSEELYDIFGLDPGSFRATYDGFLERLPEPDREVARATIQGAFRDGRPFEFDHRVLRPDGSVRWLQGRGAIVERSNGTPRRMAGTGQDITERRGIEEQLIQAQKMESVGRLAGGVAHDFNNMLSAILGFSELALASIDASHPLYEHLREIRAAGTRAAALTRQLLLMSRKQTLEPVVFDLAASVREMRKMLGRLIGEDIRLDCPSEGPAFVEADPGHLEQVVLNLVVNARDAMPRGGTITVAAEPVDLDAAHALRHPGGAAGRHVRLLVRDTGTGMDDATLSRLFEPFFTTKEKGKGTGLGLSTVYGIVKQNRGHIEVDSAIGRGTEFRVYLPAPRELASDRPKPATDRRARGGGETILVVEDEDQLRTLVEAVLRTKGYRVLLAKDGPEGLALCGRHEGEIHLLLTDLVLPGLGGDELARRAAELRPGIRVLLTSGYSDRGIRDPEASWKPHGFLEKPFRPSQVAEKVREVLDRA